DVVGEEAPEPAPIAEPERRREARGIAEGEVEADEHALAFAARAQQPAAQCRLRGGARGEVDAALAAPGTQRVPDAVAPYRRHRGGAPVDHQVGVEEGH